MEDTQQPQHTFYKITEEPEHGRMFTTMIDTYGAVVIYQHGQREFIPNGEIPMDEQDLSDRWG